jgi:hypothetical protein
MVLQKSDDQSRLVQDQCSNLLRYTERGSDTTACLVGLHERLRPEPCQTPIFTTAPDQKPYLEPVAASIWEAEPPKRGSKRLRPHPSQNAGSECGGEARAASAGGGSARSRRPAAAEVARGGGGRRRGEWRRRRQGAAEAGIERPAAVGPRRTGAASPRAGRRPPPGPGLGRTGA